MDIGVPGLTDAELIGRGAFGSVYRARQHQLNRSVAVKVFQASGPDTIDLDSFRRECSAIGKLDWCPHIVTVFSAGVTGDGRPYMVMEYAPGGSLADSIRQRGRLPEGEVLDIARRLTSALAEAHEVGILHRDIKPANVLLSRGGDPLLADFGVSGSLGTQSTNSQGFTGTVAFCAPEVLDGGPATARSDIFSLGATLYGLLTGRSPFSNQTEPSLSSLVARALAGREIDVSSLALSEPLGSALTRCLATSPDERFASARDLLEALEAGGLAPTPEEADTASSGASSLEGSESDLNTLVRELAAMPSFTAGPAPSSARWPTATDYVGAVQLTPRPLERIERLGDAATAVGSMGMPMSASGQSAIVFTLEHPLGEVAMRCFTRSPIDAEHRYRSLAQSAQKAAIPELTPAAWMADQITVGGRRWPVVVMPWVAGQALDVALGARLGNADQLRRLAEKWLDLVARLRAAGIAHGDLQSGNILVEGCDYHLVDLDACYAAGDVAAPDEYGHPHYQHPRRASAPWGPDIDGFSALTIYLAMLALAHDPDLWRFNTGENLILTKTDFTDPGASEAFSALLGCGDPEVTRLARLLADYASDPQPPSTIDVLVAIDAKWASIAPTPPVTSVEDVAGSGSRPETPLDDPVLPEAGTEFEATLRRSSGVIVDDPGLMEDTVRSGSIPVPTPVAPTIPARAPAPDPVPINRPRRAEVSWEPWWDEILVQEMLGRKRIFGRSSEPPTPSGTYSARIDRVNPASVCILVDQSLSMRDRLGDSRTSKSEAVSRQLNQLLYELILRCVKSPQQPPLPYFHISVIGYGGEQNRPLVPHVDSVLQLSTADPFGRFTTTELAREPLRIATATDPRTGGSLQLPVWVEPRASGGTPMCNAIYQAGAAAADWVRRYPTGYPPIVINLTDGSATDGDPIPWSRRLRSLRTSDGHALMFNVNLSGKKADPVLFPTQPTALADKFAKKLFEMSSVLPQEMVNAARSQGLDAHSGSRAFVFNADIRSLALFLNIGTSVGRLG